MYKDLASNMPSQMKVKLVDDIGSLTDKSCDRGDIVFDQSSQKVYYNDGKSFTNLDFDIGVCTYDSLDNVSSNRTDTVNGDYISKSLIMDNICSSDFCPYFNEESKECREEPYCPLRILGLI